MDIDLSTEVNLRLLRHIRECEECNRDLAWALTVKELIESQAPVDNALVSRILKGLEAQLSNDTDGPEDDG